MYTKRGEYSLLVAPIDWKICYNGRRVIIHDVGDREEKIAARREIYNRLFEAKYLLYFRLSGENSALND